MEWTLHLRLLTVDDGVMEAVPDERERGWFTCTDSSYQHKQCDTELLASLTSGMCFKTALNLNLELNHCSCHIGSNYLPP